MRAARLKRTSAAVQLPPGARRRFKLLPANHVWLKLEHSFKSEWLNTPGHLSQGHLEVNGFDFAPWHPWQKPAECEFSSGSSQMDAWEQKKKEKGIARCLLFCFWARSVGSKEEPRLRVHGALFAAEMSNCVPWWSPLVDPCSKNQNGLSHFQQKCICDGSRQENLPEPLDL